ncbi:hypothetical protein [Dokdonella sp.]|uniref:hypothetical protein n=1 Tax=Dokdonella sp. TaxID=2291710 RepID=UPI00378491FC
MKVRFIGALLLLVMSVQVAGAADKANPAVNASDKDSFQTVSEWVRKQMDAGGRYAETNGEERQVVNARLDEMSKLFEQKSSVDQMSIDEKKKLLVDQEEINSILGKRDGDRLICKSERPIGSNLPVKTCVTARERDQRRREDNKELERQQVNRQKKWG